MPSQKDARKSDRRFNHPALGYAVALAALGLVLAFAWLGISVAGESEASRPYVWVPRLLAAASGLLIAATVFRLLRRLLFTRRKHG
jgi:hypothetical protein